ncbi:predicted protein [Nematostella vectensis]|uniref:Uncharacterized protein n=1 Tax=Nematostella vectensis TaxID=45351 RepID=A7T135_NEMVE|nr:predicted protein [Nematostella vectensis]|eukprot:XP_001622428.1 predicted protein [Nematostella vectensis]
MRCRRLRIVINVAKQVILLVIVLRLAPAVAVVVQSSEIGPVILVVKLVILPGTAPRRVEM